jgi:hypothetical protein
VLLALTAVTGASLTQAAPAAAAPEPVTVVARGLTAPFGLTVSGRQVLVADQATGSIVRFTPGRPGRFPAATGLRQPTAVATVGKQLAIVTAGAEVPDTTTTGDASLLLQRPGERPRLFADLEKHELAHNPDGQLQFDPTTKKPLDALSNPFAIVPGFGRNVAFVADAGANAVLSVSTTGRVRTFYVPPIVNTGRCKGVPNNDPAHVGCDSVPTGLAYGPGATLYVSALTNSVPGEGRVYVLDRRTGRLMRTISGLTGPTGVAVAPDGTVYVSEVLHNAPAGEGPPPPGFDPSSVGRIVKIAPDGRRTFAAVTMPTGLAMRGSTLYASAWSIAAQFGLPRPGQVVQVRPSAFRR